MVELPGPRSALDDDGLMTIACREFVELVTEHLEGLLPEPVEGAIAVHLELCEPCLIYLEQIRATARVLRSLPTPSLAAVRPESAARGVLGPARRTGRPLEGLTRGNVEARSRRRSVLGGGTRDPLRCAHFLRADAPIRPVEVVTLL